MRVGCMALLYAASEYNDMENDLLAWSKKSLDYWMSLARLHDTYGLPVDLIYVHCDMKGALPQVIQNGSFRPVTSDEFDAGIKDCVKVLQVGGLEYLAETLLQRNSESI